MDLLFIGDPAAFDLLAPMAEQSGVRLYPAHPDAAASTVSAFAAVLDGALVSGGSTNLLHVLGRVAPRLPVVVLDLAAGAGPEALERSLRPEVVLKWALTELTEARRDGTEQEPGAERTASPLPHGGWIAHAAYRLRGVTTPRDAAEAARFSEGSARWHRSLADSLACLPTYATLRVRYAAVEGSLRVGVIVSVKADTDSAAEKRLADVLTDLAPLVHEGSVGDGAYVLSASDSSDLLVPLRARSAVALAPPSADDLLPLFDVPAGDALSSRTGAGAATAEDETGGVALPVTGADAGALGPLLRLLLDAGAPALVEVSARPAPLSADELARAREIAQQASALVRHAAFSGPRRLARRAVQLALEGTRALEAQVFVAVEAKRVPAVLVTETARAFVGDPATVNVEPARADVQGGLLVTERLGNQDLLAGRMAPDEATFRLPAPGLSLPGLRPTHPARLVTPADLSDTGGVWGHAPDGRAVRVSAEMLTTHALIVGATGTGKSTLCEQAVLELAEDQAGALVLDPHGTLARRIRDRLPAARRDDVVWIDAGDPDNPARINLLDFDEDDPAGPDRVYDDLYAFFDAWYDMRQAAGPMFELHLRQALRLLLADPTEKHALPSLVQLFTDESFRKLLVMLCEDQEVKQFWEDAEQRSGEATISNIGPYIFSKINRLLGQHAVRRMVSSPETTLDVDGWLESGAIVLCSLPVGRLGAEGTGVIGSVILSRLIRAGFARLGASKPNTTLKPLTVIADEAHRFATGYEAETLMAEGRKTGVGLVLATQRLASLRPSLRGAALANSGLIAAMRVGVEDAALLAPSLVPSFLPMDLLQLGRGEAAVRLSLPSGEPARPFLMRTVPPAR